MMTYLKRFTALAALLALAVLPSGCVSLNVTVPLAEHASSTVTGGVQLFSTDNVPFEYKEIAYHTFHGECHSNDATTRFCREAKAMGGDAVLSFRCRPGSCERHYVAEGIVVKVTKP